MIDLDELERLEKEATPGPWENNSGWLWPRDKWAPGDPESPDTRLGQTGNNDAQFIAAMRNALPALIRELRAARECIAEFRQSWELDPDEKHALILYDEACK